MSPSDSARDDLAYLKSLVQPGDDFSRSFGRAYFAAGLCYGIQMLLHGAQMLDWIPSNGAVGLLVGLGPTLVFLAILAVLNSRGAARPTLANRAVGGVFASAGAANLVLVFVIGYVAWGRQSLDIWLIYPCTVVVMQGAAWLVAAAVRRRAWFLAVSLGWFGTGIGMAIAIGDMAAYIIVLGLGFLAFMLVPGLIMMRAPREAA
jgi:hypothetical protein